MASFNELLKKYVNKDYDELRTLANEACDRILAISARVLPQVEPFKIIISLAHAAIAVDGKLSQKEKKMLADVLGFDESDSKDLFDIDVTDAITVSESFASMLNSSECATVVLFVAAIAACDETIEPIESNFLIKLLSAE